MIKTRVDFGLYPLNFFFPLGVSFLGLYPFVGWLVGGWVGLLLFFFFVCFVCVFFVEEWLGEAASGKTKRHRN